VGKLLKRRSREEREQIRRERREKVRGLARDAFGYRPFWEVDMDGLGKQLGLRPGATVFLFDSKEHLLLDLIRGELERWRQDVEAALEAESADPVACVLSTLVEARLLGRLLAMLPEALDGDVEMLDAISFLRWWNETTERIGQLLDRAGGVPEPYGAELVRKALRLVAGVQPFARPKSEVALAFDDPGAEALRVDLADELESVLRPWLAAQGVGAG
jgi:AcrR family transcriptional regulator